MKNKLLNERVNKIMGSLDSIGKATAPDFFYTRLVSKMEAVEEKRVFPVLRPAFIAAILSVFLIVNVFSLLEMNKTKQNSTARQGKPVGIESFLNAYDMQGGSVYE